MSEHISFVMGAYNCADWVGESVESIVRGNFEQGDELIIVDDCSTDSTALVLSNLHLRYPFIAIVHNAHNKGAPASRNVGIERASNPIVFNLDSDNLLVPGSIERLKRFMISEQADVAAFAELHCFKKDKGKVDIKWICRPGVLTLADFFAGTTNPGPSGNFMFTKESWQRVGKYWEYGLGLHDTWGFSLKQIAMGSKFVVMPGSHYFHRYGHHSLYIRETQNKDASSLVATKMITPFLHLIDDAQAAYIRSEKGSKTWFEDRSFPLRLKTGERGKTGHIVVIHHGLKNRMTAMISGLTGRTTPNPQ